jgi:hypothetical protein
MSRAIFILLVVLGLPGSGCRTYSPQTHAVWQKYLRVKQGMTSAEVFAIEPSPEGTTGTVNGDQLAIWHYGSPFANEDYADMDVVFGKDGRVVRIDRQIGHGHIPRDILTAP